MDICFRRATIQPIYISLNISVCISKIRTVSNYHNAISMSKFFQNTIRYPVNSQISNCFIDALHPHLLSFPLIFVGEIGLFVSETFPWSGLKTFNFWYKHGLPPSEFPINWYLGLGQWLLTETVLRPPPREHLAKSVHIWGCDDLGDATGIWGVEVWDAVKQPAVLITSKKWSGPKCQ